MLKRILARFGYFTVEDLVAEINAIHAETVTEIETDTDEPRVVFKTHYDIHKERNGII